MGPDTTDEDDEALGSMLIAWYMSGYHTGYYLVGICKLKDTFFQVPFIVSNCTNCEAKFLVESNCSLTF